MRSIRVRNQSGQSNALALVISGCKTALKSPTVACAGCIAVANARQPTSSWVVSSGDMRYRSTCDGCPAGNLAAAAAGGPPQANSVPLFCPQTGLWCALTPHGPARPPQSVQACRAAREEGRGRGGRQYGRTWAMQGCVPCKPCTLCLLCAWRSAACYHSPCPCLGCTSKRLACLGGCAGQQEED